MTTGLVGVICCAGYCIHSAECPRVKLHEKDRDMNEALQLMDAASREIGVYDPDFTILDKMQEFIKRIREKQPRKSIPDEIQGRDFQDE